MLLPVGVVVVDAVGLRVVLRFERAEEVVDLVLGGEIREEPTVAEDVPAHSQDDGENDEDAGTDEDVALQVVAAGVVGGGIDQRHGVGSSGVLDTESARFGCARECIRKMHAHIAGGQQVDREQVEADGDAVAVLARKLAQPGPGHEAELVLLAAVDGGVGGSEVAGGTGLDLEDDQGWAIPGDEVDVAADFGAGPALGDDGETEPAEVEEGSLLAAEAGDEVGWEFGGSSTALERFQGALLEGEAALAERCGGVHRSQRFAKIRAARNTVASSVSRMSFQLVNARRALSIESSVSARSRKMPTS